MRTLLAAMFVAAAVPALAQTSPSFDCAKASNAGERAICATPELAKADRDMAAIYAALAGRLGGPAKDHLAKDQLRWIGDRNRACVGEPAEVVDCLKWRYKSRTDRLKLFGQGIYPFISERSIAKSGKVKRVTYRIDASYPQFDGQQFEKGAANFTATNRRFAEDARKAADDATPGDDVADDDIRQRSYDQGFVLYRPGSNVIAVGVSFSGYSGGAHGYAAATGTLVDLRTGNTVGLSEVFAPGDEWLKQMVQMVGADLKTQFDERPGFDDALDPANLAKLLKEPERYLFHNDRLEIIFNSYDVGPYVSGPYTVELPYAKIRALLRPGGPVGN